jgi:hypothetical protein
MLPLTEALCLKNPDPPNVAGKPGGHSQERRAPSHENLFDHVLLHPGRSLEIEHFARVLAGASNLQSKPDMPRKMKELWLYRYLRFSDPSRAMGAALIALSLLRWPVTAMLASAHWELPVSPWVLIPVVQGCAEAMFWVGVWLVGRKPLRAAMARFAAMWPVSAILARMLRVPQSVKTEPATPDD